MLRATILAVALFAASLAPVAAQTVYLICDEYFNYCYTSPYPPLRSSSRGLVPLLEPDDSVLRPLPVSGSSRTSLLDEADANLPVGNSRRSDILYP